MKRILVALLTVVICLSLTSHELFLKTDAYFLSPGQASELYLFNGTFDTSENVITRDRIVDATIVGPDYEIKLGSEDYYDKDNATFLRFKAGKEGTYTAGVSTAAKVLEMTAEKFNEYLEHEGLEGTIAERKNEGSYGNGAKEKYSKHVKALLQVGAEKTQEYAKVFGYPIEFIPVVNPYRIEAGQPVAFKLLRDGKPLANHMVHYSTSMPGKDAHDNEISTKTDDNGIVTMTPNQSGNWYVATIHMEKSNEKGLDYESNWATLTFGVK
jgi:uncharacterized GH25 family protein